MVLIKPHVCLRSDTLTVTSPCNPLPLSLPISRSSATAGSKVHQVMVCGSSGEGGGYDEEVDRWFSVALGRACRLVRQGEGRGVGACKSSKKGGGKTYHSNGAALMAVSRETMGDVERRVREGGRKEGAGGGGLMLEGRLRPNLILKAKQGGQSLDAYWEDKLEVMSVPMSSQPKAGDEGRAGGGELVLSGGGPCFRCLMVNVDPEDATVGAEPFLTVSSYRRDAVNGRVKLGVLLSGGGEGGGEGGWLRVPCTVKALIGA
jgi:uncharacterized protein YcbX